MWLSFKAAVFAAFLSRQAVRVRGFPERRMQVPVCGTGRGLDNHAGFVVVLVLVLVVVVLVVVPPP